MFRLTSVSKHYGSTRALHQVDLLIPAGETTVLIGPSGCGKSTLLRLLIGLIEQSSGEIYFEDERLTRDNLLSIRRRVGYVVQGGGLFPHLTARRNVTLMARELGWEREKRDKRIKELRDLVRLPAAAMDRYPNEMSGGQQQRVSLMRALMLDPRVLLLDEPLGALDPLVRTELQDQLQEIFSNLKITVVMVTHDMSEAAHFAGRIVLMQGGRIVQHGTVEDLTTHPAEPFVSEFITAQRAHRF